MEQVRLEASGLWLDPNELTTPPGALREALNVRIKRANIIEPRPGFPVEAVTGASGGGWQVFAWDGVFYVVIGGELWRVADFVGPAEVTAGGSSLSITSSEAFGEPMGRCFYVTTNDGVYRIAEPGDVTAVRAGVPVAPSPLWELVPSGILADDEAVSVRVIFTETVNGQLLVGAPSEPIRAFNTSGSNKGVGLQITLPVGVTAGMSAQVYRTLSVAVADPTGDEMYLAQAYTITPADVTAGYVDAEIMVGESPGASLYTNETQEGILQAAYPPPKAKCLAWWKNMGFYGDITPSPDNVITGVANTRSSQQVGSYNFFEITTTNGSPVATYSAPYFFYPGVYVSQTQRVATTGSTIQEFSRILSVTPTTITLDKPATASATLNVYVLSVLDVDGEEFINGFSDVDNRQFGTWYDLMGLIPRYTDVSITVSDPAADVKPVTLRADHPFSVLYTSINPAVTLEQLWDGTPTNSTAEDPMPSRVMWSKTLQPEAVPLLQYQDLGDWRQPVMRLIPTRDSLFVLKADGVWRITGESPDTLSIENFDLSVRLIHRRAADAHDNRVWAWTTTGVVAFSEAGVERISEPSIRSAIEAQQENVAANPTVGGAFITGCGTQGCVLVGVPAADATGADATTEYVYVFETNTGAWVRWTAPYQWRGGVESGGSIVGVTGDNFLMRQNADCTDITGAVNITAVAPDGSWAEVALFDDAAGYRLTQGSDVAWITGEDAAVTDRWNVTAPLAVGAATAAVWVWCEVTWCAPATSGVTNHWRQLRAQFSSLVQSWRVRFGFTSERVHTESSVYVDFPDPTAEKGVNALRVFVTRAQARCARLRPTLRIISAGQRWTLEGLTLTGEPMRSGDRLP